MQFAIEQVSNERITEATNKVGSKSRSRDQEESQQTVEKSPTYSSQQMQSTIKSPNYNLEENNRSCN